MMTITIVLVAVVLIVMVPLLGEDKPMVMLGQLMMMERLCRRKCCEQTHNTN